MEGLDAARLSRRGQALVEFGLAALILAVIISGTIEFGLIFGHKVELNNAARAGARWGASNSLASASLWSGATSPPSNSIEGQILAASGAPTLRNDDSHILIQYFDVSSGSLVLCGHIHVANGSATYVTDGSASQAQCVAPGHLLKVTLTNSYPLLTNLLPASPTLISIATFEVMS